MTDGTRTGAEGAGAGAGVGGLGTGGGVSAPWVLGTVGTGTVGAGTVGTVTGGGGPSASAPAHPGAPAGSPDIPMQTTNTTATNHHRCRIVPPPLDLV